MGRISRGLRMMGVAAILVVVSGFVSTPPTHAESNDPGIARFIKMRWPFAVEESPDQEVYFIFNPDGIRQLYKIPIGKTQSAAVKLTDFPDGISGYEMSDDGRWIVVSAATGGSEQSDLFLFKTLTGKITPLLQDPNVVYGGPVWRRDSQMFAYRANDESPSDFHIYLYNLPGHSKKKLLSAKGYNYPVDFNDDGSKLIVGRYHSASFSQVFEVDVDTGAAREITPKGEQWSFDPIGYAANDHHCLVNTNYRGDLKTVYSINLTNGALTPVLPDLAGKEVDTAVLDKGRTVLAVGVNDDGYRSVYLRRAYDYAPMPAPKLDKGVLGNIRFAGQYLLYAQNNARTPGVVYKWNYNAVRNPPVALTEADTQGIDVSRFRLPELIRYPSFDGTKIPAFLYLPPDYRKGKTIPFIVYYHGGPEGQFRPGFNRSFQYFLSRGYGIIAPNVRGSSGYGKAYIEADNYKNRSKSVKDGVWAAKYVIDRGYAEPRKIAAWGGSYGGFMVMAVITEAPEIFGAACDVVGIVNFETFLQQTKAYRRHLREAEYGPLSDPEFLKSISPIHKVDKITTPLMIAHGLNDPRVPIGEAMQIAVALKKRGMEVEELYFPDEGHGFRKLDNSVLYYQQLAKFFEKHLRK